MILCIRAMVDLRSPHLIPRVAISTSWYLSATYRTSVCAEILSELCESRAWPDRPRAQATSVEAPDSAPGTDLAVRAARVLLAVSMRERSTGPLRPRSEEAPSARTGPQVRVAVIRLPER